MRTSTRCQSFRISARTVVKRIGRDEAAVAQDLYATFAAQRTAWQQCRPADWAQESFSAARDVFYALPSTAVPNEHGTPAYALDKAYEQRAEATARQQLAKAGFRLAALRDAAFRWSSTAVASRFRTA